MAVSALGFSELKEGYKSKGGFSEYFLSFPLPSSFPLLILLLTITPAIADYVLQLLRRLSVMFSTLYAFSSSGTRLIS